MPETSARRIRIVNPDLSNSEKTILDSDYSSGTSLTVKSNYGFQNDDVLVIEEPSSEKCESSTVSGTIGNTTISLDSALKFSHQKGAIIYRAEFNQVEISYKTSSTSNWTTLDTIGIKWDDNETIKIHQGATNNYQYRFRFYNSASSNYSEYSQTIGGGGYNYNQIGRLVDDVRSIILDFDRKIVSDSKIIEFLSEGKKIIQATRNNWYFWKKEDEGTITTIKDTRKYDLDTISAYIEYISDVRYNDLSGDDDTIYPLKFKAQIEFDQYITDNNETLDDHLERYTLLPADTSSTSGYIKVDPSPLTTGNGKFFIRYYEPDTDYTGVADTTAIPITSVLVDYAVSRCEEIKGNDDRATKYLAKFYGSPSAYRDLRPLTGIALLEQMQKGKYQAIGQPKALKYFRGRAFMSKSYGSANLDRDNLAENWFDYPVK